MNTILIAELMMGKKSPTSALAEEVNITGSDSTEVNHERETIEQSEELPSHHITVPNLLLPRKHTYIRKDEVNNSIDMGNTSANSEEPLFSPRSERNNNIKDHAEIHVNLPEVKQPSLMHRVGVNLLYHRSQLHILLTQPYSSKKAQFISFFVLVLILLSSASVVIQTLPNFMEDDSAMWFATETTFILLFTSEFLLRLFSTPNLLSFFTDYLNWVDILAIVPYYVEFLLSTIRVDWHLLRAIRVIRVFRIIKLTRYSKSVTLFVRTLAESLDMIYFSALFFTVIMIISSSSIYFAERGIYDAVSRKWMRCVSVDSISKECTNLQESPYQSIVHSFYWSITTLTTVGYGDAVPITTIGKMIGACTMMLGVLVIAIPTSILGSKFEITYQKERERELQKKIIRKAIRKRKLLRNKIKQLEKANEMAMKLKAVPIPKIKLDGIFQAEPHLIQTGAKIAHDAAHTIMKGSVSDGSLPSKTRDIELQAITSSISSNSTSTTDYEFTTGFGHGRNQHHHHHHAQHLHPFSPGIQHDHHHQTVIHKDQGPTDIKSTAINTLGKRLNKAKLLPAAKPTIICRMCIAEGKTDRVLLKRVIELHNTQSIGACVTEQISELIKTIPESDKEQEQNQWIRHKDKFSITTDGYEIPASLHLLTVAEMANRKNQLSIEVSIHNSE